MGYYPGVLRECSLRPAHDDDVAPVAELLNRQAVSLYGEPDTSETEVREQWTAPGFSMEADVRIAERSDGTLAGVVDFFNMRRQYVRPFAYVALDPDEPGDAVCEALVQWAMERAVADIPRAPEGARVTLTGSVESANDRVIAAWRRAGFSEQRRFYQMQIDFAGPPPPALPPAGYRLRTMRRGEERAVYDMAQLAFRDHFGHVEPASEEEDFRHWLHYFIDYDGFDPETQLVAEDGSGAIAGMCLCRPDDGAREDVGWVGTLGVLREHRRKGLAEALLRRSFAVFREKGKSGVALGVDADSLTSATRLYEKCGMYQRRVFLHLGKVIRDGEELANLG